MANTNLSIITEEEFGVKIALAYGTTDNFTGKLIYKNAVCALLPEAAECLRSAAAHARRLGYTLVIYDAFRPREAQQKLWDFLPDPHYVTSPEQGSAHTRGVAVDLGLLDAEGNVVNMGTGFDDMTELSHTDYENLPLEVLRNRAVLLGIMLHAGFKEIKYEWWHYQLPNAFEYPLLESDLIKVVD
ncbi:D-alanyl-D-alanine dipeptidase [Pelistega europaea]|uniref:D-alanyl-D-alanine dipeptidase n=1 Tax=Pelistega europaea TaxID=106147 RepID=A0A7Y4L9C9_9BURK|nr:D-alanyl-D-alanine dipeptidase [Pelistega europaea]NOL49375.1 D-alanyl-D-alanine dipeptidase [Pelistega europaea]